MVKKRICLLVIASTIFVVGGCQSPKVETKKDEKEIDYSISVKTAIEKKEDCCICGTSDRSMMDYYRKSGMVGVVCLNTMNISNLDTRLYSNDGTEVIEPDKDGGSMHNTYDEGKVSITIDGMEYRGIFEANISYDEDSKIDFDKTKEFLCQECLDKVASMYEECMRWTEGEGRFPQVCLVDFATNELYPLSSHELGYNVRDFWVHIDHEKDSDNVMVIYAPKNKMN